VRERATPRPGTGPAAPFRSERELGSGHRHHRDCPHPECARETPGRFLDRVYTEWEQMYCRTNILHLSGRWAAKEAVSKVLGLGGSWRRLERDRDPPHARRATDGHSSWARRGSASGDRIAEPALGIHIAHPRSCGRGRRRAALTERSSRTPLDARVVRAALKPLPKTRARRPRGRVLIIGGSLRYPGAALLASRAALRCGAGVVTIAAARTVVEAIAGEDPKRDPVPTRGSAAGCRRHELGRAGLHDHDRADPCLLVGPGLAHAPRHRRFRHRGPPQRALDQRRSSTPTG